MLVGIKTIIIHLITDGIQIITAVEVATPRNKMVGFRSITTTMAIKSLTSNTINKISKSMTAATSQGAVAISLAATNLEAVVINPAVAHIRDQAIHLRILLTLREHSPNHS